jgi:catechol 2,3-dioxygenase-like lactoylglutathione lyase family enzyme
MKRLHVHLKVSDLDQSASFYTTLFGREPDRREADYVKWLLDEPAANIAISTRGCGTGVDHLGIQLEDDKALSAIAGRLNAGQAKTIEEPDTTCCYARSNKHWAQSPDGVRWELFHTFAQSASFSGDQTNVEMAPVAAKACCG